MLSLLKLLTVFSAGMFAGAAFYCAAVEHPARLAAGVSVGLQEFRKSYPRATPFQVGFAGAGFLGSFLLAVLARQWGWLVGGVLVGAVIPFTLVFLMPTNRLLLDIRSPLKEDAARTLLEKWGRLHIVRACLGLAGFFQLLLFSLRS